MSIKVDVGTPSSGFEEWTTAEVRFHGFANLPAGLNEDTCSPEFSCLGHKWEVHILPGGDDDSDDGMVAVWFVSVSDEAIKVQWCCSVRDAAGKEVVYHGPASIEDDVFNGWMENNFCSRSALLDALIEGTLIIEVRMKLIGPSKLSSFIPANPLWKSIVSKFNDEESADVVFEVGMEVKMGKKQLVCPAGKKAKTTTSFYAHRFILQDGASTLAEMIGEPSEGTVAPIAISDVKPDIFRHMLYYLYGGKLTGDDLKANAKDIINACDKYGVVGLKLEAEVSYVKSTAITVENMMDNLLYADSKNLALLKEAVMDYVVANREGIIGKVSFSNVPGDMMTDLLTAVARRESGDDDNNGNINYNKMRVGTLRKMLHEKGLDVDGSREAMIALLKENSEESDDEVDRDEERTMLELLI